jgi:hypothetical protein
VKQFVGTSNDYSNLSRSQGFLNSNILSSQTIQQLYGSKIGLGISPEISVYPLDVVGSINGDYYYRGGVRQFMGTSNEYSNLTQSQGFINSNVLSTQTIPKITTTEILLNSTNINTVIDDKITTASNALVNYNNHTNKPWINSGTDVYNANAGNIGIGTATPSAKLDIVGTTKISNDLFISGSVGIGTALASSKLDIWGGGLRVNGSYGYFNGITINGGAGLDTIKNTNDLGLTCDIGKNIYFNVGAGGEVMRVHNNACVGIGVNSPVFKLDVGGTTNANGLRLNGYLTTIIIVV